ncbi:MAG: prepilin-type N-terminal cleavage/methylation domain-containing protein [Patescibacteria group bacterium]
MMKKILNFFTPQIPNNTHVSRHRYSTGFTIIELLITVVVIAILATITMLSYNGIKGRAIEVSVKSDLRKITSELELDRSDNVNYPLSGAQANSGLGLKVSPGNTYTYTTTPYGYCVTVSTSGGQYAYSLKSKDNAILAGSCTAAVTSYAGSGTLGYVEGPLATARFEGATGVVIDSSGAMFISDRGNNRIRKITTGGTVETFAGSGAFGVCTPGTGTAAGIAAPDSIAIDNSNNLYVSANSWCVMKITPDGVVTRIGGGGGYGGAEGSSAVSQFRNPREIAVDSNGNVYVADSGSHKIRKITSAGVVSTFAGSGVNGSANGTGAAAQFSYPSGLAINQETNTLYVTDANNTIRQISIPGAVVTPFVGSTAGYQDGTGSSAKFNTPTSLGIDWAGNMYVTEQDNSHRVRKVTPAGVVTTLAGNGTAGFANGVGTATQFNYPNSITIDRSGNLYTSDAGSSYIRKIEL